MKEKFTFSESKENFTSEEMKNIIQDVIDDKYEIFNIETMADYDADFSNDEPLFLNIWNKAEHHGFGYIVFHDFLRRVGVDKTFLSTDFTDAGKSLFDKAIHDELIKKVREVSGLNNFTRWQVISDPVENLKKIQGNY